MVAKKMIKNISLGAIFLAQCMVLVAGAAPTKSSLLQSNLPHFETLSFEHNGDSSLEDRFEAIVQHYCFMVHSLIERTTNNKIENTILSKRKVEIVQKVEQDFQPTVDTVRKDFFGANMEGKGRAVRTFTNYILCLCRRNCRSQEFHRLDWCTDS